MKELQREIMQNEEKLANNLRQINFKDVAKMYKKALGGKSTKEDENVWHCGICG